MASIRTALRRTPRVQLSRTPASFARRSYATPVPRPASDHGNPAQAEQGSEDLVHDAVDPNMNGNYPDPSLTSALPIKRQFRDPYADWWDPIERRNYGEPVHEDNDILGALSTEDYTHFTPGFGAVLFGTFAAAVGVLCAVCYRVYPDKPSAPRTFPGGLDIELGGAGAVRARKTAEESSEL